MGVDLVADIPDQAVARGVEDVVQGDRQLDDAKPRAEVSARLAHGADRFGAQLVGKLAQLRHCQRFHVGGRLDAVKQRGDRAVRHFGLCFKRVKRLWQ